MKARALCLTSGGVEIGKRAFEQLNRLKNRQNESTCTLSQFTKHGLIIRQL